MTRRHLYLFVALALTLVAVAWVGGGADETGEGVAEKQRLAHKKPRSSGGGARRFQSSDGASQGDALAKLTLVREAWPKMKQPLFDVRSFQPPPPPAPPPVKPVAPPLRYKYLGKLDEGDGKLAVFLADGQQTLIVHQGETLSGQYKVEQLTEDAITFIYLPLEEKQILNFGKP